MIGSRRQVCRRHHTFPRAPEGPLPWEAGGRAAGLFQWKEAQPRTHLGQKSRGHFQARPDGSRSPAGEAATGPPSGGGGCGSPSACTGPRGGREGAHLRSGAGLQARRGGPARPATPPRPTAPSDPAWRCLPCLAGWGAPARERQPRGSLRDRDDAARRSPSQAERRRRRQWTGREERGVARRGGERRHRLLLLRARGALRAAQEERRRSGVGDADGPAAAAAAQPSRPPLQGYGPRSIPAGRRAGRARTRERDTGRDTSFRCLLMATLLAATRVSRPLARLAAARAPPLQVAAAGLRPPPDFGFPLSALRRSYGTEVEEIGERAVLITGCDSGFGFALAKHLHEKGFIIYAGCLLKDQGRGGSKDLDNMKSSRMRTVQLNVCDSEDVSRAVEHMTSTLKDTETGLWGLVNNAGISTFGEVEFTSMDTYKEVAEVNLWGTIRTTKAFLPLIRRAKGRVVNISSMMGRMANPARSPYCITKFGVEAFSDCLRYEMRPHDVKVCIVEPGNFIAGTSLYSPERIKAIADKMWDELPEIVRRDYGRKYFDEQIAKMESYCNSGSSDTSPVIESITHALTSISPYTRYHPMDYYWWLRMQVMTHMPAAISDRLYVY